jgi:hypothetical protein
VVTWTSNIQGWKVHGLFEFSSRMQTIEIYTLNRDGKGRFVGLNHEAIFYDPEALVQPIRWVTSFSIRSRICMAGPGRSSGSEGQWLIVRREITVEPQAAPWPPLEAEWTLTFNALAQRRPSVAE